MLHNSKKSKVIRVSYAVKCVLNLIHNLILFMKQKTRVIN